MEIKGLKGEIGVARCGSELLPQAIDRINLGEYFETIRNHSSIGSIMPRSLYIYCSINPASFKKEGEVHYESASAHGAAAFYDRNGVETVFNNEGSSGIPFVTIYVNRQIAGLFFPSLSSFLLTDWTHSDTGVRVFERLWPKMVKDFKLEKLIAKKKKKIKKIAVTIGADPEFEMLECGGSVVSARGYFEGVGGRFSDEIGVDGAGCQIELRPTPSEKPHEVVKNLKNLFKGFNGKFDGKHLGVKGDSYPLGGHIHIGIGREFNPPPGLLKMLDDFVGNPLLPHSGGARGSYGGLSIYEVKPHGFEYRTPPASFFLKPEISRIVFKIAKNVSEAFINGDVISYNRPPKKEDYIKIAKLSGSEYEKLKSFISKYREMPKVATAFWTDRKLTVKKNPVSIVFRDDWNASVQGDLKDSLYKSFRKKISFGVCLYGLKDSRGAVATIPINSDFGLLPEEEPLPRGVRDNSLWIGLPFVVRNSIGVYTAYKEDLISAIKKEIKEALS